MPSVVGCSFGKDSLATALICIEKQIPLSQAVYCEVMFDKNISGEIPEHIEFIYSKAIPYLKKHGVDTVVLRSEKTYIDNFFTKVTKGENIGKYRSFPLCAKCVICRDLKMPPINKWFKELPSETIQYVGIASDETERLLRLKGNKVSLLEKEKVEEIHAFEICKRHNMLSPIYEFTNRNGCFFCPNAKEKELRHLYDFHHDLWLKMLALQRVENKATELFNRNQKFSDIDEIFKFNDTQIKLF